MPDEIRNDWTLRQFALATDVPRLLTLLAETEQLDQEGNETSEKNIREALSWPGHDPVRDRFVVEEPGQPGRLIGYALLWKLPHEERGDTALVVHPDWRRRGLGSALWAQVLARAQELHTTTLGAYANTRTAAAGAFLRRNGFIPVSAYTVLTIAGDHAVPAPTWPDGYLPRAYREDADFSAYLEAINRCYAGLWGHHHVTEEEARQWLPTFSHDGLFLLYDAASHVVGTCRAEISELLSEKYGQPVGLIDAPGIVEEHRGDDLYVPLLLATLTWLSAKQPAHIKVESWGDAPETLAHYQQLGFAITRQEDSYRLDLQNA